jgi:hypothetical protein
MSVEGMIAMKEQFATLRNGKPLRDKDIHDLWPGRQRRGQTCQLRTALFPMAGEHPLLPLLGSR